MPEATTDTILLSLNTPDIVARVHRFLAVIGKRAVNTQGESFFVALTTSLKEDPVFDDLIAAAAETIVSNIPCISANYNDTPNISFEIHNLRWTKDDEELKGNLTKALETAIPRYVVNYCIGHFLSSIYPANKTGGIPMYGQVFIEHCNVILSNIRSLAYLKRPAAAAHCRDATPQRPPCNWGRRSPDLRCQPPLCGERSSPFAAALVVNDPCSAVLAPPLYPRNQSPSVRRVSGE